VEILPTYADAFNALGGVGVPFEKVYQGEVAVVSANVNRWNAATYLALANRPRSPYSGGAANPPGTNMGGDVGSMILTEGLNLGLTLQFQFGSKGSAPKPALIAQGLPDGYFFPAAIPVHDVLEPLGTMPEVLNITFACIRAYDPLTQTFVLYTQKINPGTLN
jgi:hypothetical protein